MHSPKYSTVKKWYDKGKWTKEMVWNAVEKGWITEEEYWEIVGEEGRITEEEYLENVGAEEDENTDNA